MSIRLAASATLVACAAPVRAEPFASVPKGGAG